MSSLKVTSIETGEVLHDSQVETLTKENQNYLAQLAKLADKCDGVAKENLEKIREAAIRRIVSGNPRGIGSVVEPGEF